MKLKVDLSQPIKLAVKETSLSAYIKKHSKELSKSMDKLIFKIFEVDSAPFRGDWDEHTYHESARFFHISLNEQYIGYVIITASEFKSVVWITEFYIEEEYRSKGYGKEALFIIKQMMKHDGYKKIALTVVEGNPAERLYRKSGFNTVISTELLCKL